MRRRDFIASLGGALVACRGVRRNPLREASRGPVLGEVVLRCLYDLDPGHGIHVDPDPADGHPQLGGRFRHQENQGMAILGLTLVQGNAE
jgi:hypothetical protein